MFAGLPNEQPQYIQSSLEQANMFMVANRQADGKNFYYFSMLTFKNEPYLVEVATAGTGQCKLTLRTGTSGQYNSAILDSVEQSLKAQA